ncbi:MAG: hypothetical protein F4X92_05620 [Gammaproteobacteria bacterium]|nr:hypothetical protein [Gammaproteobacteria bacterium]
MGISIHTRSASRGIVTVRDATQARAELRRLKKALPHLNARAVLESAQGRYGNPVERPLEEESSHEE